MRDPVFPGFLHLGAVAFSFPSAAWHETNVPPVLAATPCARAVALRCVGASDGWGIFAHSKTRPPEPSKQANKQRVPLGRRDSRSVASDSAWSASHHRGAPILRRAVTNMGKSSAWEGRCKPPTTAARHDAEQTKKKALLVDLQRDGRLWRIRLSGPWGSKRKQAPVT